MKKFWIKKHDCKSYVWDTEITSSEDARKDEEDFQNSLCVVPFSYLERSQERERIYKEALEKIQKTWSIGEATEYANLALEAAKKVK